MKYAYFPGCSLKGTGRAYEESFLAVCGALGMEVEEIPDWNCCGATAYMSVDETQALALAARNLALAERLQAGAVVAPCSGCYLELMKSKKLIEEYDDTGRHIRRAIQAGGLTYFGKIAIRHPLDVFVNDVGLEAIRSKVRQPLTGLHVAPYYGCQVVRPFATFDDQRRPTSMDRLLEAAGAAPVDFPLRTRCCGGSLTGTVTEVGLRLTYILLREATRRGADVIAACCPLCQFNLDSYQREIKRRHGGDAEIPVVYFTQLLGLALGAPADRLGLRRNISSVRPLLAAWA
ncbi:MAG: CoB--CoM heterodisulfide reductase iron-sulfur subunit B family protein [Candidatus Sumerlaeota bacterium]|nr:CoB--CoM heterodisulfide reductase iron-sulfur subunit B family protein [Candidatus Sumerlaeota bacterium]